MANVVRDPDGRLWEEREGKWYEVTGARAGGMLAAQGMGPVTGALVGAGRELTSWGRKARSLLGDEATGAEMAGREAEDTARFEGSQAVGPSTAMTIGGMLPSLATAPIGMTARGAAAALPYVGRALTQLGGQAGVGGLTGYLGSHSGDAGMDSMVSALLGAGGWGGGQLAGKVVGAIRNSGAVTRQMMAEAGQVPPVAGGGGGLAGQAGGAVPEAVHLGAATGPVGEAVSQGAFKLAPTSDVVGAAGLTEEGARQIARGKELGFRFFPGQEAGNRAQMQMEASAMSSPASSMWFEPIRRKNEAVLNRTAVRALGEDGSAVTQQVLNSAHLRLGRVFEDAAAKVGTVSGEALESASMKLSGMAQAAGGGESITPEVARAAGRALKAWEESGSVTGKRLLSERTDLAQFAIDLSSQGKGLASQGVRQVVDVLDELMEAGLPAGAKSGQREALREARGQWRILTALETGAAVNPNGSVRAGSLYGALKKQFPVEMVRGNFDTFFGKSQTGKAGRDLMDAVRITQSFRDVVSDSGTATRMSLQGFLTSPVRSLMEAAIVGGGGKLYMSGGGQLARQVLEAEAVKGVGSGAGGVARGFAGGIMGGY